jgi:hypothetical protein
MSNKHIEKIIQDALIHFGIKCQCETCTKEISDYVASLSQEPQQTGWVSVEERLPESGEMVLFICKSRNKLFDGRIFGGKFYATSGDKYFSIPGTGFDASYWLPLSALPAPPQQTIKNPKNKEK